jgi:hypothetical protein
LAELRRLDGKPFGMVAQRNRGLGGAKVAVVESSLRMNCKIMELNWQRLEVEKISQDYAVMVLPCRVSSDYAVVPAAV